jgi:uncharacterized membrane protein YoaK (UPF0700 family)
MMLESPSTMSPAPAQSPILQARLAISLAWVAGYTNIIAVLVCGHVASHVTGHASQLGQAAAGGDWNLALFVGAILVAFFLGAVLSACATEIARWRGVRSVYVVPAALELVLLAVFAQLVRLHDPAHVESGAMLWWMTIVASIAMGLQNATITRISGGVVRTTHLTGVLTDLGLESVRRVMERMAMRAGKSDRDRAAHSRADEAARWRLLLLASIFGAFVVGSSCGVFAFQSFAHWSMIPPIALLGWVIAVDIRRPIAASSDGVMKDVGA